MRFEEFLEAVKDLPIIDANVLASMSPDIRVQISRWVKSGKLIQVKRRLYVLPPQYRKKELFELFLAATLKQPSYISLEKALEYHNLIPEGVSVFTSVTTKRQARFVSAVGVFDYRHIKPSLFWGYSSVAVNKQTGFMATPEKALLDFLYLKTKRVTRGFLEELRLQNLNKISVKKMLQCAEQFKRKNIVMAAHLVAEFIKDGKKQEKKL